MKDATRAAGDRAPLPRPPGAALEQEQSPATYPGADLAAEPPRKPDASTATGFAAAAAGARRFTAKIPERACPLEARRQHLIPGPARPSSRFLEPRRQTP